jgi:DNA-binding winged helix-turn-helix (wHTH) protein/uncharacterized membrane protein HdeD (DUF308 family)
MIEAGEKFKKGELSGVAAVKGGSLAGGEQSGVLSASRCVVFGDFRFNLPTRELWRIASHGAATPISLGSRAADLLHLFLRRPGELIPKSEIMDAVWPNVAVEESNLTVQISALRRALGDGRVSYIQTVPGRGYRFTARVSSFSLHVEEAIGKETTGRATIVPAAAGALKMDSAEPSPRNLLASPESVPLVPAPLQAVPSESTENDDVTMAAFPTQQRKTWWLLWLQGMAGIVLGLMLVTAPGLTIVTLVSFLGFYWLIVGILALVRVFVDRSVPWIWSFLAGIVGILAGIFVVGHPLLAALTVPTAIVIVLGGLGLIMGAIEIVGGFVGGGIGPFILGVTHALVGLLLLGSPVAAALAAPLAFGVLFLVQGVALTVFAFRVRT